MANHHGSEGTVKIGANAVAEVNSWSISESAEFAEDTNLSDTSKTYNSTAIKSWSGSISCNWDETDTTGQGAMTVGASVTLNLYPEGADTGDTYWTGTALIQDVSQSAARGGIVEAEYSFLGTGALSETTV